MAHADLYLMHPTRSLDSARLWLSADERARAERFVLPADAERWAGYRAGLRKIIGEALDLEPAKAPLIKGPGGKPALAAPYEHLQFNLSHADDLAAVIVSSHGPVGIDIEPWSRASSLIECAEFFCHPDELDQLPDETGARATRLLELWTSKEALLKATGTGLTFPPEQLLIDGGREKSGSPPEGLAGFRVLIPDHPALRHHCLAIAVTSSIDDFVWHHDFPIT